MTKQYRCDCGWIGAKSEMDSDFAPGPDEMWSNHICPSCKEWQRLDDYERIGEGVSVTNYDPPGIEFTDRASGKKMKLATREYCKGWILYRNHGQWISLRKATRDDLERVMGAVYDQEVIDMLAGLAAKHRPPHNQDPGGKLRAQVVLGEGRVPLGRGVRGVRRCTAFSFSWSVRLY